MTQYLKADCINNAYQEIRISGLTVQAGPEENKTALRKLEAMANEFEGRNVCVNYNFEDTPDLNSSAGIETKYRESFELCLAVRLLSIFGKGASDKVDQVLFTRESGSWTFLSGTTAPIQRVQAPNRMPIGSGNERYGLRLSRFYKPTYTADPGCSTKKMIIGEINDYVEHFDSKMVNNELLASYTIESNDGLTILSDSISSSYYDINYRIQAIGDTSDNPTGLYQIKIVATTDNNRVITRLITFELTEVDIA